jgi:hypothetical protein
LEHPVLRLALLGFAPEAVQRVAGWLMRTPPGWPAWRLAAPDEADAWFINGGAITHMDAHAGISFTSNWAQQPHMTLDPSQAQRPLAFALPLPADLEAREAVDVSRDTDVRAALQRFEAWLRPLRAEFALGARLLHSYSQLGTHVYHLKSKNSLIAVVDLINMRVGLSPAARPIDIEEAAWEKRPPSAADIPANFLKQNVAQVMWQYAMHTDKDILPERYHKQKIYARGQCGVPAAWLQDEHLLLLSTLKSASATLQELAIRTQILPSDLLRYLAALYYAGTITADERRAQRGNTRSPVGHHSSLPPTLGGPTAPHSVIGDSRPPHIDHDTTAPARLM